MHLRLLWTEYRQYLANALRLAMRRARMRRIDAVMHRYLALTVGLFFVLAGLTGSLNVFRPELDAWLNPQLTVAEPHGEARAPDELLAAVVAAHPRRFGSWTLVMPRQPHEMVTAWFDRPIETADEDYAPLMVSVNPYTAEVVASRFWGHTLMTRMLRWHEELFLGVFGRKVVGVFGILLIGALVTGVMAWWPSRRTWGGWRRSDSGDGMRHGIAFDAHRVVGVASVGVLLIAAITGVQFAYPGVLGSMLKSAPSMGELHEGLNVVSTARPNGRPVTLEESILLARGLYPKSRVERVQTPRDEMGSYQVWFQPPGAAVADAPLAVVCVDQYSGHILHVENLRNRPAGEAFLDWLHALHSGAAMGSPGRVLWGLAGISPLLLYLTGIYRWRRGRRVNE